MARGAKKPAWQQSAMQLGFQSEEQKLPGEVSGDGAYSAVVQQYLDIRAENPGTLILFRVGSFYEAWFDEAELLARELGLKLSSRSSGGTAPPVPQAGFAQHALEGYLSRLLQRGYRVAIVEEEEAAERPGMRQRAVARTLTPGTVTDPFLLREDRPNYLCGVILSEDQVGLAWTDVSTGEFQAGEFDVDTAAAELARIAPAEVLVPLQVSWPEPVSRTLADYPQTPAQRQIAEAALARTEMERTFTPAHPLQDLPVAAHAAGMVLAYLRTLRGEAERAATGLDAPEIAGGDEMRMDPATRRHLELTETERDGSYEGSLLWAVDATASVMGRRMLRQWITRPLVSLRPLRARQHIIQALLEHPNHRQAIADAVAELPDLERLAGAIAGGRVTVEALHELLALDTLLPALEEQLRSSPSSFLRTVGRVPPEVNAALDAIRATLADAGAPRPIRTGYSSAYDEAVRAVEEGRADLETLFTALRRKSGIAKLRLDQTAAQGWFLEVPANTPVPAGWLRKGGLARVERYTTAELEELAGQLVAAEEGLQGIERQLVDSLVQQVRPAGGPLREMARNLAGADALQSLATVAVERGWVMPTVEESPVLEIFEGRHPVLEKLLGDRFVPNDTKLVAGGARDQLMILTGPNMAGKSSLQRQVALLVLLAQAGSFVPAKQIRVGLADSISTRLGSADDLAHGQSTFLIEMLETAQILRTATNRSLCLFDELGRGTSTYDGMAIAWAVAEYLATGPVRPRTILSTHYHELNALAEQIPQVTAMRMAVHEGPDGVRFLYHLEAGGADRSFGIAVAQMAGIPAAVVQRAEAVTKMMEPATAEGQRLLLQSLSQMKRL